MCGQWLSSSIAPSMHPMEQRERLGAPSIRRRVDVADGRWIVGPEGFLSGHPCALVRFLANQVRDEALGRIDEQGTAASYHEGRVIRSVQRLRQLDHELRKQLAVWTHLV